MAIASARVGAPPATRPIASSGASTLTRSRSGSGLRGCEPGSALVADELAPHEPERCVRRDDARELVGCALLVADRPDERAAIATRADELLAVGAELEG